MTIQPFETAINSADLRKGSIPKLAPAIKWNSTDGSTRFIDNPNPILKFGASVCPNLTESALQTLEKFKIIEDSNRLTQNNNFLA